jgi:PAP2 superfamily
MSLSAVSQSASGARALLWGDVLGALRENSPLILFVGLYGLGPIVIYNQIPLPVAPYTDVLLAYLSFAVSGGLGLFAAFALWYLYHARVRKVPNFQAVAWQRIKLDFLSRDRVLLALPVLLLWPIPASAFSYLKSVIPLVQPFYLDPLLRQWDLALHFGIDPWRILQPLLGHTWITYAINFGYALWFFVLQAALVLQAGAAGNRRRRMQFLLTMALAWALVGNLAATAMSSAGPCFYALVVGGPDPYAPLMGYLRDVAATLGEWHVPFTAIVLQDLLWESYATNGFGLAEGISAAPSMHIASSWIIWRLSWELGRRARIAGSLFLAVIFTGSIHLGWHYAVDGYLAVAFAWALWRLVGWLLNRRAVQAFLWPNGIFATNAAALEAN